jgi:hypothetical protein
VRNMVGGNAWINRAAFRVMDAHEFHAIMLTLGAKGVDLRVPQRSLMLFLFALHASFGQDTPRGHGVTEAAFRARVPNSRHLDVGTQAPGESCATVVRDSETYSMLRGYSVSPWVRSILGANVSDV